MSRPPVEVAAEVEVEIEIMRADLHTVDEALPLLLVQMQEHRIPISEPTLKAAVRGLVEVPGRGAVLLARVRKNNDNENNASRTNTIGVAVLAYTWTIEHGGFSTWLDELYVVPEMRGAGIGTKLLHHAIDLAKADGCRAMDLEVDLEHARVESLYLREGFQAFGRRHFARAL